MTTTEAQALATFGQLYRDESGHEVWRIVDSTGRTVQDGISGDYDAAFIAAGVAR